MLFFFRDDTHKVDVINFAQSKATQCLQSRNLVDRESANLLWNLIVLMCRQNGVCLFLSLKHFFLLAWSVWDPAPKERDGVSVPGCAHAHRAVLAVTQEVGDKQGVRSG